MVMEKENKLEGSRKDRRGWKEGEWGERKGEG